MCKAIFLCVALLSSFSVLANQTSNQKITMLHFWQEHNGVLIRHEDHVNLQSCPGADKYILRQDHPFFTEIYSLLLSAHLAEQPLVFHFNGCFEGYPSITHVYSYK